ncbi:MAG: SDR family oxidoreductase [Chloroflexales bacterium]|nr:SDR family oxidoreductase [Chloroflexales bacterium]
MRQQEAIVIASDRDWTIVRRGKLVTTPVVTRYHVEEGHFVAGKRCTGRADVADFMLNQLANWCHRH